jgi:hypothetical protein
MKTTSILAALALMGALPGAALAQQANNDPTTGQQCNVKTQNVKVCGGDGSGSIGISGETPDLGHLAKYPIGQSDASVAKQVGNTVHKAAGDVSDGVHHFFSHL